MTLYGYIKPFAPLSFSIPVYTDAKEYYYHVLESDSFRIRTFELTQLDENFVSDCCPEISIQQGDYGVIVFADQSMNVLIERADRTIIEIISKIQSLGDIALHLIPELNSVMEIITREMKVRERAERAKAAISISKLEDIIINEKRLSRDRALRNLKLAFPVSEFYAAHFSNYRSAYDLLLTKSDFFLVTNSILTLIECKATQRNDVLTSVLLAQLAAENRYPKKDSSLTWANLFNKVLSTIGWNISRSEISVIESIGRSTLDQIISNLAQRFLGRHTSTAIKKSLDRFYEMDITDKRVVSFEKNSYSDNDFRFQVGVATNDEGRVNLKFMTFILSSNNKIERPLLSKSYQHRNMLSVEFTEATLNSQNFEGIRESIAKKLGDSVTKYITDI